MLDDRLNIDTPENVTFGYEVVGIGSRFLAALVDMLLITLLQVLASVLIASFIAITAGGGALRSLAEVGSMPWVVAVVGLISFIFYWGYYMCFEVAWNGQSPGKRWVGIRAIRNDGLPIGLAEAVIRNLVRAVDLLPAFYGVGIITMFVDSQSRRLGDLAAGTVVVRDRGAVSLESLAKETAPKDPLNWAVLARTQALEGDPPLERLTATDLQIMEDYLRRRGELANRAQLALQVAGLLRTRLELSAPDTNDWRSADMLIDRIYKSVKSMK